MDRQDIHLRYVSVLALVIHPEGDRFLVGYRSSDDPFWPDMLAFPGGRLEGDETLEQRLYLEISQETGLEVDPTRTRYVGEIVFEREGYPVNQLLFAVHAKEDVLVDRPELKSLRWMTLRQFDDEIGQDKYLRMLQGQLYLAADAGHLGKDL